MFNEKDFFEELHKIFKSNIGRSRIISALIEAIRLDLMEKRQKIVSFEEACSILIEESNEVINSYVCKENTQIIKNILKDWGLN